MRRTLIVGIVTAALGAGVMANAQAPRGGEVRLKAAQHRAEVEGDLKGAIEDYRKIVAGAGGNRAVAAEALVRMAECYQKLGDIEAQRIYERVVRDYPDQRPAVLVARAHLGGEHREDAVARSRGDRAVWTGSKVDMFGRVSPDGRYVTYVDWALFGNLAVHDVAANTDHFLTSKQSWDDLERAEATWSAISPDGKQVGYGWQAKDPEIRMVPLALASQAEPRRLFKFPGAEVRFVGVRDWSPDGKSLAVGLARTDGTSQIGILSVGDGTFRVLKSADWRGADRLAFSSDSKYLAYDLPASDDADQRDVFIMAVDGSREVPVVVHTADDRVVGWSPDGRYLLFTSDRSGSNGLWVVAVVDGRPQGGVELLKADIGADSYPLGLTKGGSLFAYKNISSRDVKIARIDLAAGKIEGQPVHFSQGYAPGPQNPHWSPDGKYLAYQTRGREDGLAIRSIETGEVRQLPRKLLYARDPRWAPDGKSFIVSGRDGKGRDGIYRIDVQTGVSTPIVYGSRLGTAPRWSADGSRIYYRDFAHPDRVVERVLDSGVEREVVRYPLLRNVEVSPDGTTFATQTTVDPASHQATVLLVSIADGTTRELVRLTPEETMDQADTLAWTPDSRAVVIAKKTEGRPALWVLDTATHAQRKLAVDVAGWTMSANEGNNFDRGFSLSPDGRHIAFLMGKSAAEVWALENFLPPTPSKQTARK